MQNIFLALVRGCCTLLVAAGLFSPWQVNAQDNLLGLYVWKNAVPITPCDIQGKPNGDATIASIPNQKFQVIATDSGGLNAIIQVLLYVPDNTAGFLRRNKSDGSAKFDPKPNFYSFNYKKTDWEAMSVEDQNEQNYPVDKRLYFKVPVSNINKDASPYRAFNTGLCVGAITLPFRYRIQKDRDFTADVSISSTIGVIWGSRKPRKFTHVSLVGAGFSQVNLDSFNTSKNQSLILNGSQDVQALTFIFGHALQYERLQVGFFVGMDLISQSNQQTFGWKYYNKPWISFGVGYALFNIQKEKNDINKQ